MCACRAFNREKPGIKPADFPTMGVDGGRTDAGAGSDPTHRVCSFALARGRQTPASTLPAYNGRLSGRQCERGHWISLFGDP